ncbi:MAG: hypothetical protein AAF549_01860 [Pseudomonadota bacterium]
MERELTLYEDGMIYAHKNANLCDRLLNNVLSARSGLARLRRTETRMRCV